MDSLHSGVRASSGSSVRLTLVVVFMTAACALSLWGARELVHLEPYTVELNLLVPRLDVPRLARMLRVLQAVLAAALVTTMLVRRRRRDG